MIIDVMESLNRSFAWRFPIFGVGEGSAVTFRWAFPWRGSLVERLGGWWRVIKWRGEEEGSR